MRRQECDPSMKNESFSFIEGKLEMLEMLATLRKEKQTSC